MNKERFFYILKNRIFTKDAFHWYVNYLFRILRKYGLVDDKTFLKNQYRCQMGERLDLDNPISFNQKLQWLKLYDRQDRYSVMTDKYTAKEYVRNIFGADCIIPTYGIYDSMDSIDFSTLPNKFVLKATQGSGNHDVIICKDKSILDLNVIRKRMEKSLSYNCYSCTAEWVYKNIKPRIIIEKLLEDSSQDDIVDYKFMCFNGRVKCTCVCTDRNSKGGMKMTIYDRDWNIMPFERSHPSEKTPIKKPVCYDNMITMAEQLSKDISFLRVDFYEVCGKYYFGEMTFYPASGFGKFQPQEWDNILGSWIELPKEKHYAK